MSKAPSKASRKPVNRPATSTAPARPVVRRPRARKGNPDDYAAIRHQILTAALRLNRASGGVESLALRTLADEVGLSAMALYRYFPSKAALLQAMWEQTLTDALSHTSAAAHQGGTARERLRAGIEAFLSYWEKEPDRFWLVFMNPQTLTLEEHSNLTDNAAYQNAVQLGHILIGDFIREVNGDPMRLGEARDLRMAQMIGYLHARVANQRFAWSDLDALRRNTVDTLMAGMEACVKQPATRAGRPAARKSPRSA